MGRKRKWGDKREGTNFFFLRSGFFLIITNLIEDTLFLPFLISQSQLVLVSFFPENKC